MQIILINSALTQISAFYSTILKGDTEIVTGFSQFRNRYPIRTAYHPSLVVILQGKHNAQHPPTENTSSLHS